jgi:hypothetical protein
MGDFVACMADPVGAVRHPARQVRRDPLCGLVRPTSVHRLCLGPSRIRALPTPPSLRAIRRIESTGFRKTWAAEAPLRRPVDPVLGTPRLRTN